MTSYLDYPLQAFHFSVAQLFDDSRNDESKKINMFHIIQFAASFHLCIFLQYTSTQ